MSFNRSTWNVSSPSSGVSVAGHAPVLRKQRSCSDNHPAFGQSLVSSGIRANGVTAGRAVLRKQASVDQATRGRFGGSVHLHPDNYTFPGDGEKAETSMRVFTTVKKRVASSVDTESTNTERMPNSSLILASQHRRDDRINLNIFLTAASNSQDGEPSDIDSEKESSMSSNTVNAAQSGKGKSTPSACEDKDSSTKLSTAADRRAAFQSSKSILSVTGERRPPLIRAMSAPIRPATDDAKTLNSKRRPIRRRRIGRDRSTDTFGNNEFILETADEDGVDNESKALSGARKAGQMPPRSRSVMGGCDVVTLVSLLSSGGSDSEKDEPNNNNDATSSVRAPTLRKSGKSVSFQESENAKNANGQVPREFPMILRRASIAPLAARIRANRPPTAPPGSIYMRQEFGLSEAVAEAPTNHTETGESEQSPDDKLKAGEKVPVKLVEVEQPAPVFPEFCRTQKERDCWTLFQKMAKKGVSVSYDTILRGMLTPTEMRGVLKQREMDAEKLLLQQLTTEPEPGAKSSGKQLNGPPIVGCS